MESAIFGGGCFWCLDAVFREVSGVRGVTCGYAGGDTNQADYESVCAGTTGHAEVVRIDFDPTIVSYETLLTIFFSIHDPTTLNRQGHDVGSQYRSLIICLSEAQKSAVEGMIRSLTEAAIWPAPIVTEIAEGMPFHAAEDYHQNYFARHPDQGYCAAVIAPKLARFRREFPGPAR